MLAQTIELNCTGNKLSPSRYVRLTIPNPDSHKHVSLDCLAEKFEGKLIGELKIYAAHSVRDLRATINSERQEEDEELQKLFETM